MFSCEQHLVPFLVFVFQEIGVLQACADVDTKKSGGMF